MRAITFISVMISAGLLCAADNPPSREQAAVARAEQRGAAIFQYDRAAWITSDDLAARMPASRRMEVGGWIVTPAANGVHVDFFGRGAAAGRALYSADVTGGTIRNARIYPADTAPALGETAQRMTRALAAARAEMERYRTWRPCARAPFNSVVLPPQENGVIPVYFLTPQTDAENIPFGGHYLIEVAPDGRIASKRAFSRACIAMPTHATTEGSRLSATMLTHLLDPQPTEVHVFAQYGLRVPLFVATESPTGYWEVRNGRISRVDLPPAR